MSESETSSPFVRIGPERLSSPIILSVPHAGRDYRPDLLKSARLSRAMLETLEDRLVDRLVWRATAAGITTFVARAPRAEIDLNRDEREIDPLMVAPPLPPSRVVQSARTRGGIGLIPSRITGVGAIWAQRVSQSELRRRLDEIHRPYHQALAEALADARRRFGGAVLLDCHSMPPRSQAGGETHATVVFGDRHGTAAAPELVEAAVAASRALGFRTVCNAPYAGGYISGRHGDPARNIHAIQLEIDRSVYLDVELRGPGPGFAGACALIASVVEALETRLLGSDEQIAAE